jgi:hypothetical protein
MIPWFIDRLRKEAIHMEKAYTVYYLLFGYIQDHKEAYIQIKDDTEKAEKIFESWSKKYEIVQMYEELHEDYNNLNPISIRIIKTGGLKNQ